MVGVELGQAATEADQGATLGVAIDPAMPDVSLYRAAHGEAARNGWGLSPNRRAATLGTRCDRPIGDLISGRIGLAIQAAGARIRRFFAGVIYAAGGMVHTYLLL